MTGSATPIRTAGQSPLKMQVIGAPKSAVDAKSLYLHSQTQGLASQVPRALANTPYLQDVKPMYRSMGAAGTSQGSLPIAYRTVPTGFTPRPVCVPLFNPI